MSEACITCGIVCLCPECDKEEIGPEDYKEGRRVGHDEGFDEGYAAAEADAAQDALTRANSV